LWRSAFTGVLSMGMAASTSAQYVFGVLAPFLIDEFDISRSRLGLLTTATFLVGTAGSPVAGRLVDRIGGRRVFVASMTLVGASTLGMAAAPSFGWLLAGAAAAGGALTTCNPTTNKLIAAHISTGRRGVITGVKQAGVQVGAFGIGVSLPAVAVIAGWRAAVAVTVVVPLAATGTALRFIPPDEAAEESAPVAADDRRPLSGTVWWLAAYAFLMGAGVAVFGAYLPLYAEEEIGLSVGTAGFIAAMMGLIGVFSRIAWGWGTERIGQFSIPLAVMGLGSVAATALFIAADAWGAWALVAGALLFGATGITWNAVGMLAVLTEVGAHEAGRASGYVLTGFYLGFVVSPGSFGYSVDATGSYTPGWTAIGAVFIVAALVAAAWHRSRA